MERGQSMKGLLCQAQAFGVWPTEAGMWKVSAEEEHGQINMSE